MFKQQMVLALLSIFLVIGYTNAANGDIQCLDPFNTQTRTDSAASSTAGLVVCGGAAYSCGRVLSTGQGVCVSGATATPTATVVVTAVAAVAATVAGAAGANVAATAANSFTSAQGQITACWNPAGAATVAITNTATSVAAACYTNTANVGSAIMQTVATGTTASTVTFSTSPAGAYCFTTDCNKVVYVRSSSAISSASLMFVALSTIAASLF